MKNKILLLLACCFMNALNFAQQGTSLRTKASALPLKLYNAMRDSTTSMDIVMMQGEGGSLSLEGRNVRLFSTFFDHQTAEKLNIPLAGTIMWQINGKELISGNYFLGDTTGFVVFQKDGREYINQINSQGNSFLKGQIKK